MKLFKRAGIKNIEQETMLLQSISELELMERAATEIAAEIESRWGKNYNIYAFAGSGNNGGDALATARILSKKGYTVKAYIINPKDSLSPACEENKERLRMETEAEIEEIIQSFNPPRLTNNDVIIDGIFGIGINKPLVGGYASIVKYLNVSNAKIVSIDIPSGMMTESNSANNKQAIINADVTITVCQPKIAMLLAENQKYIGELVSIDIGFAQEAMAREETDFYLTEHKDIASLIKKRDKFAHKGTFGHGLLIAGSKGMAGAAMLSSKACMRSGIGLLTVCTTECNRDIQQMCVPEAMVETTGNSTHISSTPSTSKYDAMAIGVGLKQHEDTEQVTIKAIASANCPIVIDADAINIVSRAIEVIYNTNQEGIITPHIKEFERLVGEYTDSYDRIEKAIEIAKETNKHIIIKGANTAIITPKGKCHFNTTGNAGMATAGSGDVLTGILLALLAQGYNCEDSARIGVYIHGLAGDIAKEQKGEISLIASDIIDFLPYAWKQLSK